MNKLDPVVVYGLAEVFLSGPWDVDGLVARGERILGRRYRFLRPLARRVLAAFTDRPRPRIARLDEFLWADEGLCKAACRHPLRLRCDRWPEPTMMPAPGAPGSWPVSAIIYKPISPRQHHYLDIPGFLFLAVGMSVMVGMIFHMRTIPPWLRLWTVLTVLGLSGAYDQPPRGLQWSYATFEQVLPGRAPIIYPNGYVGDYPLSEYDEVLAYIKENTSRRVSIANALAYPLALTGPTARLCAFPTESMSWLRWVRPDDEEAFVKKLEGTPESIVVWSPREFNRELAEFGRLEMAIRRLYEPERRFSDIEIWKRKASNSRRGE